MSVFHKLGTPTVAIPGLTAALILALTFGVYLWADADGNAMYAGFSSRGLARPLDATHPAPRRGTEAGLDVTTWTLRFWAMPDERRWNYAVTVADRTFCAFDMKRRAEAERELVYVREAIAHAITSDVPLDAAVTTWDDVWFRRLRDDMLMTGVLLLADGVVFLPWHTVERLEIASS